MKIFIDDTKSIRAIQDEFTARFPNLGLGFFTKVHERGESSLWDNLIDSERTLGQFRHKHYSGEIEIIPEMTVTVLEETFHKKFGLFVQVLRRAGNVWVETTATDGWTLKRQELEASTWRANINEEE